jgi:hypothetical protein
MTFGPNEISKFWRKNALNSQQKWHACQQELGLICKDGNFTGKSHGISKHHWEYR